MRLLCLVLILTLVGWAEPIALKQRTEMEATPVFSPGGQFLLVGGGTARHPVWNLWDVPKGQLVRTFATPPSGRKDDITSPFCASFSADARTIAVGFLYSQPRKVRVEVWRGDDLVWQHDGKEWSPDAYFALSPDASAIAMRGWQLGKTQGRVEMLTAPRQGRDLPSGFSAWTVENQLLVTASVQDARSGKVLRTFNTGQFQVKHGPQGSEIVEGKPEAERFGKSGWPFLGNTDLGLRFEKFMGGGRAELFVHTGGKVLASWPQLYGHAFNLKKTILAVVTADGVILIDLEKTNSQGQLQTL